MLKIAVANIESECPNYLAALKNLGVQGVCGTSFDTDDYDGLLLPGGGDIDPAFYGCENCGSEDIEADLDRMQLETMDKFVKAGKPVLGICKGLQVINVYFKGTLIQHIDEWPKHRRINGQDNVHHTTAMEGSFVAKLYGTDFDTNSAHHQAIDMPGEGIKVVQYSDDGIIEAIEHENLPVIATQWHPERMCFAKKRDDTVDGSLVIRLFLDMCEKSREAQLCK